MHILIAPDSFKESLSAPEVAQAIATGLQREWPDATYTLLPMADGGEGTVDTLVAALDGRYVDAPAHDPLMRPITARYGLVHSDLTAIIEVASASGLHLVNPDERDALRSTSYGTGELIRDALDKEVRHFIIGLGGSATCDGGVGMAQALGMKLYDAHAKELPSTQSSLLEIHSVEADAIHPALHECIIELACDVTNPLCGPNGAAQVYGPQKGATPEQILLLDEALGRFFPKELAELPGAGAAGGLGAGFLNFTPSTLRPGFELIAEVCKLESAIQGADLVITGEGKIDAQTAQGKVPGGVARLAQKHGKPVIAFCGIADSVLPAETSTLFQEILTIDSHETSTQDALENASKYLTNLAQTYARNSPYPSL